MATLSTLKGGIVGSDKVGVAVANWKKRKINLSDYNIKFLLGHW